VKVVFTEEAHRQLKSWKKDHDVKALQRIRQLLEAIEASPYKGLGKPEPLKYDLAGIWSRRINKKDRLRYLIEDDKIIVVGCRDHY
jgi:toxin YoeB